MLAPTMRRLKHTSTSAAAQLAGGCCTSTRAPRWNCCTLSPFTTDRLLLIQTEDCSFVMQVVAFHAISCGKEQTIDNLIATATATHTSELL